MGRKGKTNSKATKAVIIKAAKPTKKIAKKSAKKSTKILASTVSKPKLKPSRTTGKKVMHTVKPGETLYAVSRKYKLKVTLIKEWNKLKTNSLEVGQRLVVGKSEVPVAAGHRVTKPKLKPKAPRAKKRVTKTKSAKMHTVSSGETLYKVSRTYGVSVTKIKTLNKMTSNSLEVGQRLKIQ